jgi:hypothetical protein
MSHIAAGKNNKIESLFETMLISLCAIIGSVITIPPPFDRLEQQVFCQMPSNYTNNDGTTAICRVQ